MTIGERIIQKRKELGLSQEALGEQLGVSRQAIYKWESDATLPEIDKLIALSKMYGVSVGWLLGVEDDPNPSDMERDSLTQTQLDMVEEIVHRYIQSQPKQKPLRRWPWILAACILAIAFLHLGSRMDQIKDQYTTLQWAVNDINSSIHSQVYALADRVEELLRDQNNITAKSSTKIIETDYVNDTVTIALEAVPRMYYSGMSAVFIADCGDGPVEYAGKAGQNSFTARIELPLTNNIDLSVVFIRPDGIRETQILDGFSWLLSDSYPSLHLSDELDRAKIIDGDLAMGAWYAMASRLSPAKGGAEIVTYKVGLFRNFQLIGWGEPCDKPANYIGNHGEDQFFRMPTGVLEDLQPGETVTVAALITDSFGRQFMFIEVPYVVTEGSGGGRELRWPDVVSYSREVESWILE